MAALAGVALLAACSTGPSGDADDAVSSTPSSPDPAAVSTPPTDAPGTTAVLSAPADGGPQGSGADGSGLRGSEGCRVLDRVPPSTDVTVIAPDGLERTAAVAVPPSAVAGVPMPLVLDFHGLGSSGTQQALLTGFVALGAERMVVVAHPEGVARPPIDVKAWAITDLGTDDPVDDVGFVSALLDRLESDLCIDLDRVYATGMSNGGFFSTRLACELSDRIAAVASVGGIEHPDSCSPSRPISVMHVHGTADEVVPFDGGESELTAPGGTLDVEGAESFEFVPIETEVADWVATDGCPPDPEITVIGPDVELRRWDGCAGGTEVRFYVIDGGGHTWPGDAAELLEPILGPATDHLDTTEVIYDFFVDHPLSGS